MKVNQILLNFIVFFLFGLAFLTFSYNNQLKIAVLKYKGGDWYSVIGAVKNFLIEAKKLTPLDLSLEPEIVELRDRVKLFSLPFIILNGHGEILLDEVEKNHLREYLERGGFLLVNDDYGLDRSFKKLVVELYPDEKLVVLNTEFPLFHAYYKFSFLPKVHEHDGLPPVAYGLFLHKRLVLLYLFSSDIADGWEPESVHHDPKEIRDQSIQFGINILYYVLSN